MNRLLILAIKSGSVQAVETVIKSGFDPEATNRLGQTALHLAAKAGSTKICDILLREGCTTEVLDHSGHSCEEVASQAGHTVLAAALRTLSGVSTSSERTTEVEIDEFSVANDVEIKSISQNVVQETNQFPKNGFENKGFPDFDTQISLGDDWEPEDVAKKPEENEIAAQHWRNSRKHLGSKAIHDFDATWDDVKFVHKIATSTDKEIGLAKPWPTDFQYCLAGWLDAGWADEADIEQQKTHFSDRDWPKILEGLKAVLEIGVVENDPWVKALAISGSEPSTDILTTEDEVFEYLSPSDNAEEWWEAKVATLPYLSRFNEEALLNKLVRTRKEILHALSLSTIAVNLILDTVASILSGSDDFSTFSDADLEVVAETERDVSADVRDMTDDGCTNDQPVFFLNCPNGSNAAFVFVKAVERLKERFSGDETPGISGQSLQETSDDLGRLLLSSSYLRRLATQLLSEHGEESLAFEIRDRLNETEASRKKLITSHLPHAMRICQKFAGRGLDLEDISQVAAEGIMRTLETFDPERGNRFWTLAQFWVRQSIGRALDNESRTVRVPVHALSSMRLISVVKRDLAKGASSLPSDRLVAKKAGVTVDSVAKIGGYLQERRGDQFLPEVSDLECGVENRLTALKLREIIETHLENLPERHQDIVARRFGLRGFEEQTLEQIGQIYGVTRERIRQLEAKALEQLRHPSRAKKLRELLDDV